jgi:hypothetical protein
VPPLDDSGDLLQGPEQLVVRGLDLKHDLLLSLIS